MHQHFILFNRLSSVLGFFVKQKNMFFLLLSVLFMVAFENLSLEK